jgi:hypothetical protein
MILLKKYSHQSQKVSSTLNSEVLIKSLFYCRSEITLGFP